MFNSLNKQSPLQVKASDLMMLKRKNSHFIHATNNPLFGNNTNANDLRLSKQISINNTNTNADVSGVFSKHHPSYPKNQAMFSSSIKKQKQFGSTSPIPRASCTTSTNSSTGVWQLSYKKFVKQSVGGGAANDVGKAAATGQQFNAHKMTANLTMKNSRDNISSSHNTSNHYQLHYGNNNNNNNNTNSVIAKKGGLHHHHHSSSTNNLKLNLQPFNINDKAVATNGSGNGIKQNSNQKMQEKDKNNQQQFSEWRGFTHHFIAKKLNKVIEKNKKSK